MTVHFIGAGPGAADLITVRGRDIISRSPVCLYAGSLVPKALLDAAGIPYTITPGVPAFAAAAAALGQELTLPELAQTVVLTRTSGRASAMPSGERLEAYAATGATLAIHLSIHAIDRVVAALVPHYGADCAVAVVYRASWPDQRIIRATLATIAGEIAQAPIERTALILVGKVLGARTFRDSALYDAGYQRRFRGRGT